MKKRFYLERMIIKYGGFCNEIILQAVRDYKKARQKRRYAVRASDIRLADIELDKIEHEIKSQFFGTYLSASGLDLTGEEFIQKLKEAGY